MTNANEKAAEKTPVAYNAYIVEDRGPRQKPYWHRIGTGWAHEDAEGLTFPIPKGGHG
jgi:hypothetical protein